MRVRSTLPPLVGAVSAGGKVKLFDMPEVELLGMANYVGSMSLDESEEIVAATSPRGGSVALWNRRSGEFIFRERMNDVCGVAALPGSPGEDALAASSDELLIVSERRLVARTRFGELGARARSYRVSVRRAGDGLLSRLAEAGYEVRRMLTAEVTTLWVTDPGDLGTLPLFGAALAEGAPIIELVPAGPVGAAPSRDAAGA